MKKNASRSNNHAFACHGVVMAIPREQASRAEFLSRKKRKLANAFDEAVKKFETELAALTNGETLTPEIWMSKGNIKAKANLKGAATVLMAFGVTAYPVPEDQAARARLQSDPAQPDAGSPSP